MKINPDTKWGKASRFRRRIEGCSIYMVAAVLSLFWPEAVDYVMHKTLEEQFIEP